MVKQLNYVWLTAETTAQQPQNTLNTLMASTACITLSIMCVGKVLV